MFGGENVCFVSLNVFFVVAVPLFGAAQGTPRVTRDVVEARSGVRCVPAGPRTIQLRSDEDFVQQRAAHRFRQTLP